VVEQESKAWSFFHSACGGKRSTGIALGIEMEILFFKDWNGKPALQERPEIKKSFL
jgi:hypothetical protein